MPMMPWCTAAAAASKPSPAGGRFAPIGSIASGIIQLARWTISMLRTRGTVDLLRHQGWCRECGYEV